MTGYLTSGLGSLFALVATAAFCAEPQPNSHGPASDYLFARHRPYQVYADAPPSENTDTSPLVGVQIERNETGLLLGNLRFPSLFEALYKRHGAAAAHILDRTADVRSGHDIPVYNVSDGFFDYPTDEFRGIVDAADVISLSQRAPIRRTPEGAFTGGSSPYASSDGLEVLREFWRDTDTAVFHAIGNDAANIDQAYPETGLNWIFNDLYVRVGTGRRLVDGSVVVDGHSPANAVTLLTDIPEYRFRLYSEPESAHANTLTYLEAHRSFYETALLRAVTSGSDSPFNLGYCRGRTESEIPFQGRDLLNRPPFAQLRAPMSDIFRAYSTCAVETLKSWYAGKGRDPATPHNLRQIGGTSFSTPQAAGLFLAALDRSPDLSKHDVLAAMILSARAAGTVASVDGTAPAKVRTTPNGRGLPHSPEAGFGLVSWDDFAATMSAMNALRAQSPQLQTTERDTVSEITVFPPDQVKPQHGYREYSLTVADDAVFFRGVLVLSFGNKNRNVPEQIHLIGPGGARIGVAPTRYENGSRLVLAGTDAFFGTHTTGEWRIRVPEAFPLHAAGLAIEGVAPGSNSLIDTFLDSQGYPTTPDVEIASPLVTRPRL